MGDVIFGKKIGDVGIPRKAQHNLLVKCSGEKFIFSAFKATTASFQASKKRRWRPLLPKQPKFDAFESTDKGGIIQSGLVRCT